MRLIVDEPLRGSRNMSIDKALLESAAESGVATLRIYQWQPATLSLGYFQASASRREHLPSRQCPLVRRASGGGAIVHDREMTYSLALPASNRWARENRDLFDRVHQTLIGCLQGLGVSGCHVYDRGKPESRAAPFLCFQRRANGDVILGDDKVIGSAQRRLQAALLQHGSVLMQRSPSAPELPGIMDLCPGANCSLAALIAAWPAQLAAAMNWTLQPGELTVSERQNADAIEAGCFANPAWTDKR